MAAKAYKRGRNKRYYDEPKPENRAEAERDHDRVLYTSALQRLAGITQITAPEPGPTIHNRLTHTLKVAQVARRLAKRIGLDVNGQETAAAAALAHDLGHPPFGHLAERILDGQAKSWGGFEGNAQSFRLVTFLALRTADYRGLNLTKRTLDAILKYPWLRDPNDKKKKNRKWGAYESERRFLEFARSESTGDALSIEAAIMDWADDVTYAVHDLEDFFRVGLIPLDRLADPVGVERDRFFATFFEGPPGKRVLREKFDRFTESDLSSAIDRLFGGPFLGIEPFRGSRNDRTQLRYQTSFLIGRFIQGASLKDKSEVVVDQEVRAEVAVLKEVAWHYVITDPSLSTIQRGQERVIEDLHEIYVAAAGDSEDGWRLFPLGQRELLPLARTDPDRLRLATDLVASLTEHLAYEIHHRLTGISRGSMLDAAAHATR